MTMVGNIFLFETKKRILILTIWGLFAFWGFLGGVVLAEQFDPVLSSSEPDAQSCEQALAGLDQALQSKFSRTSPHRSSASLGKPRRWSNSSDAFFERRVCALRSFRAASRTVFATSLSASLHVPHLILDTTVPVGRRSHFAPSAT